MSIGQGKGAYMAEPKELYLVININVGQTKDGGQVVELYPNVAYITTDKDEAEVVAEDERGHSWCLSSTVYRLPELLVVGDAR